MNREILDEFAKIMILTAVIIALWIFFHEQSHRISMQNIGKDCRIEVPCGEYIACCVPTSDGPFPLDFERVSKFIDSLLYNLFIIFNLYLIVYLAWRN